MSSSSNKGPVWVVFGVIGLSLLTIAIVKRDSIAGLILKGGDISLVGEPAKSSPQAEVALDFLAALRASDMNALTQLTTADQTARIQSEAQTPTPDYQDMKNMMLGDLPADSAELKSKIKSVQVHKMKGVVTFETQANSWMIVMDQVNDTWKVSGF